MQAVTLTALKASFLLLLLKDQQLRWPIIDATIIRPLTDPFGYAGEVELLEATLKGTNATRDGSNRR
jgi:hypothetical protein